MLTAVRRGVPFDAALEPAFARLDDADRRLAHELAAGVLRRQSDLDARLIPLVRHGWGNVDPVLRDVLRLGAYQLSALDRVPVHAAVSVSVDLARQVAGSKAAGFVNALLRNLGGRSAAPSLAIDPAAHFAAVHSHPAWLVERWIARYGQRDAVELMEWNNAKPPVVLQPARMSADELEGLWRAEGLQVDRLALEGGATGSPFYRSPFSRVADLPGYSEGGFYVQDPAHRLVADLASAPGARIYDACAAPGGKTLALGQVAALVVSGDRRDRVPRLRQNLARAGRGHEYAIVADATHPPVQNIDITLLDAPCLGTGTFARHPDARWRVTPDALARLGANQAVLLDAVADTVRVGGWLVYATCSLEPEENEQQVERFLERDSRFVRDPRTDMPERYLTASGDLQVLPFRDAMDGAYAARLRRVR